MDAGSPGWLCPLPSLPHRHECSPARAPGKPLQTRQSGTAKDPQSSPAGQCPAQPSPGLASPSGKSQPHSNPSVHHVAAIAPLIPFSPQTVRFFCVTARAGSGAGEFGCCLSAGLKSLPRAGLISKPSVPSCSCPSTPRTPAWGYPPHPGTDRLCPPLQQLPEGHTGPQRCVGAGPLWLSHCTQSVGAQRTLLSALPKPGIQGPGQPAWLSQPTHHL